MTKPICIQTEISVADVLKLMRTGETRWYICYNIAVLLESKLKAAHMATFGFFPEKMNKSGFDHYCMIHEFYDGDRFESMILQQLSVMTMKHFGTEIVNHVELSNLGWDVGTPNSREFRMELLNLAIQDDPGAVFRIEC